MVKVRLDGFGSGHIEHLVTRAAFNSDKVAIFSINGSFIYLNCIVNMFQSDSFPESSTALSRVRKGNFFSMGRLSFRNKRSANIEQGDADAKYVLTLFSPQWRRWSPLQEGGQKRSSLLLLLMLPFL